MEEALLHGRLGDIDHGFARLYPAVGRDETGVPLRFGPELHDAVRAAATEYVEARGKGTIDPVADEWIEGRVDAINDIRSPREAFDPESFLSNPNQRLFDRERVVTAIEPFDVDEFMRGIYETNS